MLFFFKPKKIVIDFFTPIHTVYEFFSIKPAIKSTPEWWKKLPKTVSTAEKHITSTVKMCPGFTDFYKQGFMLPAWSDIAIQVVKESRFKEDTNFLAKSSSRQIDALFNGNSTSSHSPYQWGNNFPEFTHIKFLTPWAMKQKSDVPWLWIEPTWDNIEFNSELRVLPGVVQPNITTNVNIQCFIRKSDSLIEIEAGQPMLHMIPITEQEVIVKNHLIDLIEWNKIRASYAPIFKFTGGHNWIKNFKKQEQEEKKCPFH